MEIYVVLVIAAIAAVGVARKVSVRARGRARMARGATTLADGELVTLRGTVRALEQTLVAPLSGTVCVLHRSAARIVDGFGPISQSGGEIARVDMVDFVLETRDGEVIVTGRTAEVTIRPGRVVPRQMEREAAFLAAHGVLAHAKQMSCDEVVIEPGAKIVVHGVARVVTTPGDGGERGYRDVATKTRLVGDEAHPLTIGE